MTRVNRRQKAGSESRRLPTAYCLLPAGIRGFTLIELVVTVTVLAILTLGVLPMVQVAVKRQKERQLHEALREMREAIDQFHREALAAPVVPVAGTTPTAGQPNPAASPQPSASFADPRVRVYISDQTIFTADNPDRYPPDLETLTKGVSVLPLSAGGLGRRGNLNYTATEAATEQSAVPKTKVYLRRIPIDPMTGKADWELHSSYDLADASSWGGENVFNVRSHSRDKALNGEKYSDW